ncbi:Uncharacterised protein [uncultured archaeon]|nr:Uncharacterised protein [uncultured archaeon]
MDAPALAAFSMFSICIRLSGVSRTIRISGRFSFRHTSAALESSVSDIPIAIEASDFMLHGATIMPFVLCEPLAIGAVKSSSP